LLQESDNVYMSLGCSDMPYVSEVNIIVFIEYLDSSVIEELNNFKVVCVCSVQKAVSDFILISSYNCSLVSQIPTDLAVPC